LARARIIKNPKVNKTVFFKLISDSWASSFIRRPVYSGDADIARSNSDIAETWKGVVKMVG
tara:strand:- start:357 stop:539 length:183 start_codon:yes stop_codon:yes gene_type:complete